MARKPSSRDDARRPQMKSNIVANFENFSTSIRFFSSIFYQSNNTFTWLICASFRFPINIPSMWRLRFVPCSHWRQLVLRCAVRITFAFSFFVRCRWKTTQRTLLSVFYRMATIFTIHCANLSFSLHRLVFGRLVLDPLPINTGFFLLHRLH